MSKMTVKLNGKKVVIDTDKPKVANALAKLVEACSAQTLPIGLSLKHENGDVYVLCRIKQSNGQFRAYLINTDTGIARNSRKVVMVQEPSNGRGYVEDVPAEKDKFYNPDGSGEFIDC